MASVILKVVDLWHSYKKADNSEWSLRSFDLELKKGELVGLLGPSGCGKTTLLRLIAGFESPAHGFISSGEQILSSNKYLIPPERRGIGMVFQDYALFPHLNVWRNVV